MQEMIKKIANIPGVSGFEKDFALELKNIMMDNADEVYIDNLYNVIALKKSRDINAKTVLLDAHIDQIGFIVTEILQGGFLSFTAIGGVDPRMLLGLEVDILSSGGKIRGIISLTPPHLISSDKADESILIKDMMIDTGLRNHNIQIGTPIIFADEVYNIDNSSITGKCLDDRVGCTLIIKLAQALKEIELPFNLVYMLSATEETGGAGARVGTYKINPEIAIVMDVTHGHTPDAPKDKTFEFGGGCMIGMGPNLDKALTNEFIKTAEVNDIKYGIEVMEGSTGTNAWAMQIVCSGVPVALLSIPLRYMHTPIETVKLSDMQATYDLIYKFLTEVYDGYK